MATNTPLSPESAIQKQPPSFGDALNKFMFDGTIPSRRVLRPRIKPGQEEDAGKAVDRLDSLKTKPASSRGSSTSSSQAKGKSTGKKTKSPQKQSRKRRTGDSDDDNEDSQNSDKNNNSDNNPNFAPYGLIRAGCVVRPARYAGEKGFPAKGPPRSRTQKSESKPKPSSKYAPPSTYSHLSPIPDIFAPNLLLVFVGTNPGIRTAEVGHAYASPTNRFWPLLHESGLTPDRQLRPTEDLKLPELYNYGNTNLVSRPTRDQAELSKTEMEDGTPILEAKLKKWKPESVLIVGKGIWESIWKHKTGKKLTKEQFAFGWQKMRLGVTEEGEEVDGMKMGKWEGARVFVGISTSGLVAGYSKQEKLKLFKELADWVDERRKERGETAPRGLPSEVVEEAARRREREWKALMERSRDGDVKVEDELHAGEAGEGIKQEEVIKEEDVVMGEGEPSENEARKRRRQE
ncbi:DNA glycosylase [Ascodesmis nigricans]|uniref:DNA glycosylase n=1 Tax=Ascodesmis nigricans TaxID=341454 RepID=A0A4S2N250_9PEZI|nr:DNA glycosylase [Ascodesmis nigricans]